MGKISGFVIGMVLLGFIMTGLGIYMGAGTHYNVEYNDSDIGIYDNYDKFANMSESLKTKTLMETEENKSGNIISNTADLIGDFFKSGYNGLLITKSSLNTFETMAEKSSDRAGIPVHIKDIGIVLVGLVFVFTIIAILVNRNV